MVSTVDAGDAAILKAIAFARAGAAGLAWRQLDALDAAQAQTPAALSLRARLLKDRAKGEPSGERRRQAFAASADAYRAAAGDDDATYPLINAAAMALLAGDRGGAHALARRVLARLERGVADETAYYLEATRAEALLMLGETGQAKASLAAAIATTPRAWEDHASTLRQFASILDALGEDTAWLDAHRPPRTAHFVGAMALAEDDDRFADRLDEAIARENIGFGYGALAAGTDIIVAERLLAAGAQVHVVLPTTRALFVERSVLGVDAGWLPRFDAVLEQAETIREGAPVRDQEYAIAVHLGTEIAMGRAARGAGLLESEALQIVLRADDRRIGDFTASAGEMWLASKRRQIIIGHAARARPAPASGDLPQTGVLAADLAIGFAPDAAEPQWTERLAAALPVVAQAIAAVPPTRLPSWSGDALRLGFANPRDAAAAARMIMAALPGPDQPRMAIHYGIGHAMPVAWSAEPLVIGRDAALLDHLLAAMPAGAIYLSDPAADALAIGTTALSCELVGEIAAPGGLAPMPIHALVG